MLPLIAIGATQEIQDLLHPLGEVVSFYGTAEQAHRGLVNTGVAEDDPDGNGWHVHVAYGPGAFGALGTGRIGSVTSSRLTHTGYTIVLGYLIDPNPGAPRPVVDGQTSTDPEDRSVWQAAIAVNADLMLDLATPDAAGYLLRWLETR